MRTGIFFAGFCFCFSLPESVERFGCAFSFSFPFLSRKPHLDFEEFVSCFDGRSGSLIESEDFFSSWNGSNSQYFNKELCYGCHCSETQEISERTWNSSISLATSLVLTARMPDPIDPSDTRRSTIRRSCCEISDGRHSR